MKIVAILGSHRQGSSNTAAPREAMANLAATLIAQRP
jgi:NAD(P)H-dependent FMN reductase